MALGEFKNAVKEFIHGPRQGSAVMAAIALGGVKNAVK